MKRKGIRNLILAAAFLALGIFLPLLTAQVKEIGDTLLPMHIPVMLCGLFCGFKYGFFVGAILPFLRSLIFSMPPLFPNAVWMAAELCTYGVVIGFLYSIKKSKRLWYLYVCLGISMIFGRIVWGITKALLLGFRGGVFTFSAFFAGGFIDAFPGIILQLIIIPLVVKSVEYVQKGKSESSS